MVPVISIYNKPLMPCTSARARLLMKFGAAKPWYQKNIFCIKMLREASDDKYQEVVLGIDPGSKREGYTVTTETKVVMNITTNTKDLIKERLLLRRNARRSRRSRKTPYRKCRYNRSRRSGWIPPSTLSRWGTKLNMIKYLYRMLPITTVVVEDIVAKSIAGKNNIKNKNFSPLQVGKNYFYSEIIKMRFTLHKVNGFNTARHRVSRGFKKSKKKLEYVWEAHNVDSHCLCEIVLSKNIEPIKSLFKIEYISFNRRKLNYNLPGKYNIRKKLLGSTSINISRGSYLYIKTLDNCTSKFLYKDVIYYFSGLNNGFVRINDSETGILVSKNIKKENIKIMYRNSRTLQFININTGLSSRDKRENIRVIKLEIAKNTKKNIKKNNKPDKNTLENIINKMPFTKIGEKYNVSDNCIRKWCISYGIDIKKHKRGHWLKK